MGALQAYETPTAVAGVGKNQELPYSNSVGYDVCGLDRRLQEAGDRGRDPYRYPTVHRSVLGATGPGSLALRRLFPLDPDSCSGTVGARLVAGTAELRTPKFRITYWEIARGRGSRSRGGAPGCRRQCKTREQVRPSPVHDLFPASRPDAEEVKA